MFFQFFSTFNFIAISYLETVVLLKSQTQCLQNNKALKSILSHFYKSMLVTVIWVNFQLILELFWTYFLNILNAPLSDLSWKTEICRSEDLRGGAFSIRLPLFSMLSKKTDIFSPISSNKITNKLNHEKSKLQKRIRWQKFWYLNLDLVAERIQRKSTHPVHG